MTSRPSSSRTRTPSPTRSADGRPGAVHHLHAASAEDVLDDGRRVGVLAGQHPVARGDQHDLAAEAEVGVRQLGAGDAGADDDQLLGQLLQVVDLLPGEDALAIRHRRGHGPGRRAGGHQDDVRRELLGLAGGALQLHPPGRDHPAHPRQTRTPSASSRVWMSWLWAEARPSTRALTALRSAEAAWSGRGTLDAHAHAAGHLEPGHEVGGGDEGLAGHTVGEYAPRHRRRHGPRR